MSRKSEMSRNFAMCRGKRFMRYGSGFTQRPYRHILPLEVSNRQQLAQQIGITGNGATLLLSPVSLSESRIIDGTGFGVKPMPSSLIGKLDGLSLGKKRGNVNISL